MELLRLIIMIFMVLSVTCTERNNTSFNELETSLQELRNLKDKLGEVNLEKKVLQELAKIAQNISERSEELSAEQDTSQQSNSTKPTKSKISKDKKFFWFIGLAAALFKSIAAKDSPEEAAKTWGFFAANTAATVGSAFIAPYLTPFFVGIGAISAANNIAIGVKALKNKSNRRNYRDFHRKLRHLVDKNKALFTQYEKKLQEERSKIVLRAKHGTANQLASNTKPTMSQAAWVKDAYQGKRSRPSRITQVMSLLSSPKVAKIWSKVLKEVISFAPQP